MLGVDLAAYRERWLEHAGLPCPYVILHHAAERGDGLRPTDARQIEADLPRSAVESVPIADHILPAHLAALRRLLRAWCVLRPDIGYAQSMNFIGTVMLVVCGHSEAVGTSGGANTSAPPSDEAMQSEADALGLFLAMMERLPDDFYSDLPPLRGFQADVGALLLLLERRHPSLFSYADLAEALPLVCCKCASPSDDDAHRNRPGLASATPPV